MNLPFVDPCKISLKEIENIIITHRLEKKLSQLLDEINRVNYNGYIKLSKPKDYYSPEEWENILITLQKNILEAKAQANRDPLPIFLEKMLNRILLRDDFTGFQHFLANFSSYLPAELVKVKDNEQFISWVFLHLQNGTLTLDRSSLRLSADASPEDLGF